MDRLISEQAVLEVINNAILLGRFYYGKERTIEEIKAIPSAEPKTGHREYNDIYDHYLCGNCKTVVMDYDNYCPNCGAKLSENPTGSKDVIWYDKRNYSEIVVEPQERSDNE